MGKPTSMDSKILISQIFHWAEQQPQAPALFSYDSQQKSWQATTWAEYNQTMRYVAKGLLKLGLQPKNCVGIIGNNRIEWSFTQFGIIAACGIPAPIYTTLRPEQIVYVVNHCECAFVFAENAEQYDKFAHERPNISIKKLILFEDVPNRDKEWTMLLSELIELGKKASDEELEKRLEQLQPDDTALLIYTSGTTGKPKGVILTHHNLSAVVEKFLQRFPLGPTRVISYLPLSHIAEQAVTNLAQLYTGGEVFFCSDINKVKDFLPQVKPTLFMGVPRVWEKFAMGIESKIKQSFWPRRCLVRWALNTEKKFLRRSCEQQRSLMPLSRKLARKLVINKIIKKVGFQNVAIAASGAAPIDARVLEFFTCLGIMIIEVYGLSETSGIISSTTPDKLAFGTVGRPFKGVEVKFDQEGQILVRGANMSPGYLKDSEQTQELWKDGWLHTGDIGKFDQEGNLQVTDRKKNILITAGGKNVAPAEVEQWLTSLEEISHSIVIGDKRPYLTALLTLEETHVDALLKKLQLPAETTLQELSQSQKLHDYLEQKIEKEVNSHLARYQTIKKFAVLPKPFSVDSGELTPTLKMKRKLIAEKYQDTIESLYQG